LLGAARHFKFIISPPRTWHLLRRGERFDAAGKARLGRFRLYFVNG